VTGVRGFNQSATGTGIIALGTNITAGTVLANGSGLAANGTANGVYAIGTNAATGVGVMGGGTNITTITNTGQGEGVVGNGLSFGVTGYATAALSNDRWGGYFDYLNSVNGYLYVGGRTGATDYAFLAGVGAVKSGQVRDAQGNPRIIYCTEAPEVLLEDYGTGQMVNGRAHIEIDPILAQNIYVNDAEGKPLRVFIQLEGDCKGVYVTNKTATGFDVVELDGGTSNINFTWHVVGNRADAKDANGNVTSTIQSLRFPQGVERVNSVQSQPAQVAPAQQAPALPEKLPSNGGVPQR
jgi:hypothetical protein